ncbi:MAG: response regulator transcription factor [Rudaea sp.]
MKVLLVDDHALFRAGLRMLLAALGKDLVIREAGSADEALAILQAEPDITLCLLDLSLKSSDGLALLKTLKQTAPDLMVVVVSASDNSLTVRDCIEAGAMSFIPKSAAPEVLTFALQQVLRGAVYLPPEIALDNEEPPSAALTARQREVLKYLSQGLPTKLIARQLSLSEYTVKEHITSIFQALHVRNRTEAVIRASRLFMLHSP